MKDGLRDIDPPLGARRCLDADGTSAGHSITIPAVKLKKLLKKQ